MDESLAWLTQKTEEPKYNKGNFTPPNPLTHSKCNWNFYTNPPPPPFSELSPLSKKIFDTPQVIQFLEGPTPLWEGGRRRGDHHSSLMQRKRDLKMEKTRSLNDARKDYLKTRDRWNGHSFRRSTAPDPTREGRGQFTASHVYPQMQWSTCCCTLGYSLWPWNSILHQKRGQQKCLDKALHVNVTSYIFWK